MGTIQNSINGVLGAVAGAATLGKHIKNQNKEIAAKNAEDEQIVKSTQEAIKNDTIEAASAIAAHEQGFADKIQDYDLKNLDDDELDELREEVDAFRAGKMTEDRLDRMNEAAERYKKYHGNKIDRIYKTGDQLAKAYHSFEELNQRIDASRKLKFNLEAAKERIKARGGKI